MAIQYLALVEETTRGTDPGSGYLFLPITGALQPKFVATDEPRKEFRGADTALGDSSVVRKESQWTYTLECSWYPDSEAIGLLLKHALGKAGTRSVLETDAYKGILYPLSKFYGTGEELANKAIGIIPNTDEGGTTKSQYWGGGRIKSVNIKGEGTDDIKLVFEIQGAGEWIDAVDQTLIGSVSFPTAAPFVSSDLLCYIGSGITRTGTAPNFTDLDPNTMSAFRPDSIDITITNGINDKVVMNGIKGPSHTTREEQVKVECSFPIDYEDPSSGFSSADEYKTLFDGTRTNSVLIVADNGELAGDTSENYAASIDLPNMIVNAETPERSTEGKTPSVAFSMTSLYSDTTEYPIGIITVDQNSAY